MYKINQLTLPVDFDKNNLAKYISTKLKLDISKFKDVKLLKLSIDARDKNNLCYKSTIAFNVVGKLNCNKFKNIECYEPPKL